MFRLSCNSLALQLQRPRGEARLSFKATPSRARVALPMASLTSLYGAAETGDAAVVRRMLDAGGDVNARDQVRAH